MVHSIHCMWIASLCQKNRIFSERKSSCCRDRCLGLDQKNEKRISFVLIHYMLFVVLWSLLNNRTNIKRKERIDPFFEPSL
mmetsp:Transcript_52911/g.158394  ORF Transcript_52911/g.158394 Transcript_52911/m.158394 type:complete len:81 (+) Transcript_52911:628-870(+)